MTNQLDDDGGGLLDRTKQRLSGAKMKASEIGDRARSTGRRADRALASAQLRADAARERVGAARDTAAEVGATVNDGLDDALGEPPADGGFTGGFDGGFGGGDVAPLEPVDAFEDGTTAGSLDPADDVDDIGGGFGGGVDIEPAEIDPFESDRRR